MLSSYWRSGELDPSLRTLPAAIHAALNAETAAQAAAEALAHANRCVVLGRGFQFATAFETALKIKELTYLLTEPYSSADFKHGPMALIEQGFPVIVIATGETFKAEFDALRTELQHRKATVVALHDASNPALSGEHSVPLPEMASEAFAPIAAIVPAQLIAFHLSRARGLNPDAPRTISKVTLTR
jgi:glucosamine--fructose-6-phosphate aminotransferase (isomerizing)